MTGTQAQPGAPAAPSPGPGPLAVARRGAAAVVVLERPDRRNAVSIAMRRSLAEALGKVGRDPGVYAVVVRSAGDGDPAPDADWAEIDGLARVDLPAARTAVGEQAALCWLLECLSKPTVSLIDGALGAAGLGLTLYGTHRVAGARFALALREPRAGRVPDCGVLHAFARMPRAIGRYLALTGREVGRADALALGLATHAVDAAHFAGIEASLSEADPVDPVLDGLHVDPGPSPLLADAARIERAFGADRPLAAIVAGLAAVTGQDAAWAGAALADMARASPLALAATDAALARAARLDIRATLVQDFRIASRLLETRAAGAANAAAAPSGMAAGPDVALPSPADVEALLADLGDGELNLPTRTEMQAARV